VKNLWRRIGGLILVVMGMAIAASAQNGVPRGTLGGCCSAAAAINDSGQAVGSANLSGDTSSPSMSSHGRGTVGCRMRASWTAPLRASA
jgi:hypothetical protein